ncbi:hypothetical protein A2U01_0108913, partial [Trifolium medium]|nr:hypothetical protein [Trifolium medium]
VFHTEQPFTCFRRLILPFKSRRIHSTEFMKNRIPPWSLRLFPVQVVARVELVVVELSAAARPA